VVPDGADVVEADLVEDVRHRRHLDVDLDGVSVRGTILPLGPLDGAAVQGRGHRDHTDDQDGEAKNRQRDFEPVAVLLVHAGNLAPTVQASSRGRLLLGALGPLPLAAHE